MPPAPKPILARPKVPRDPAPAQTAMRLAWESVKDMPGYVPTKLLNDQPPEICRAWFLFVQSQTAEVMCHNYTVEVW